MSSEPKLNVALKILRLAGHQIGDAHIPTSQDGHTLRVWIDGVPCTHEDVLKMVEEEIKESEQPGWAWLEIRENFLQKRARK